METQTRNSFLLYIFVSLIALKVAALRVKGLIQLHHLTLFSWRYLPRSPFELSLLPAGSTISQKYLTCSRCSIWPAGWYSPTPLHICPLYAAFSVLHFHWFLLSWVFCPSVPIASTELKAPYYLCLYPMHPLKPSYPLNPKSTFLFAVQYSHLLKNAKERERMRKK